MLRSIDRPRIIIADDHRLVVDCLRANLSRRHDVVAVAYGGDELLRLVPTCSADCLLLDLSMPGRNGIQLIPQVRRLRPGLRVLIVSMMVDRDLVELALRAGADGFVPKEAPLQELEHAITEVFQGRSYVSPRVPKTSHRVSLGAKHCGLHRLTPRQHQIVMLMGEGCSASEISQQLHVGPSTVTFHKHNLMRVLGFNEERELIRFAVLVREGAASRAHVAAMV